jgi:hypothetical protein
MAGPLVDYKTVISAIAAGRVVPFFGAGINLCGRPAGVSWQGGRYLPSNGEMAAYLAENFNYPANDRYDLARVSQYIAVMVGSGPLYEELHSLLNAAYPPTPLHQFFATLRYQLIVTTNYDDLMEHAFRAAGVPFDVVSYIAHGEQRGKFLHWPAGAGEARPIERPNEYRDLSLDQRLVILKLHGTVEQTIEARGGFVITEDDHINCLIRMDLPRVLPATLMVKLTRSHILFLDYSLRDWHLRAILHRIWGERKFSYKSWAIQLDPQAIDERFWRQRDVDIVNMPLENFIAELRQRL